MTKIEDARTYLQRPTSRPVKVADATEFHAQRPGLHSGHILGPGCPKITNAVGGDPTQRTSGLGGPAGGAIRRSDYQNKAGVNSRGLFSK
jgi:hypothetical protein